MSWRDAGEARPVARIVRGALGLAIPLAGAAVLIQHTVSLLH